MMANYWVVGCMSGTSLDGLDVALCKFTLNEFPTLWHSELVDARTFPFDKELISKLAHCHLLSSFELKKLDVELGEFIGRSVLRLVDDKSSRVDLVASHGHTVYHSPNEDKVSMQIGSGHSIHALTKLPVVFDFRQLDVALGGNGAPLVPVGEKFLYPTTHLFLNLGGIANLSIHQENRVLGFDVTACNLVLNHYARQLGMVYDNKGEMASKGNVNTHLFEKLNQLPYFELQAPKSLGREWVEREIFPLIDKFEISNQDKLATFCHHIAFQIAVCLKNESGRLMVTGGGAYHLFLLETIKSYCTQLEVLVPDPLEIEFKEAKIFAFLGLKRALGEANVFKTVTGANDNSVSGALVGVFQNRQSNVT